MNLSSHHDACPVGMGNEMSHGQGVGTGHQGCQRGLVENPMTQQEGTGSNSCRRNGHNLHKQIKVTNYPAFLQRTTPAGPQVAVVELFPVSTASQWVYCRPIFYGTQTPAYVAIFNFLRPSSCLQMFNFFDVPASANAPICYCTAVCKYPNVRGLSEKLGNEFAHALKATHQNFSHFGCSVVVWQSF